MLFVKDARGLPKSTDVLHSILRLFSQAMVDHLKYSLSCERFVKLQLYCYCNVLAVKKFVCFKTFFDMNHNRRGRLPRQKTSMSSKENLDNVSTKR